MTEEEMQKLHSKIDTGVKAAIERHRKLGQSISIMQDGKVVTLTADEIPVIQHQHNNVNQRS
ncbi:hypothetical protein IQ259_24195 [Fortiea sp. LEGE XX443]|uniref:hypothetical protein n=1 Tax=Fortiea sp. LEGE XX443 TaxID=1828611 RepID=UPI0018813A12|nr:hypothetical protein [Fortiea sp. LEGE XX443]MBE9008077.1 hypothetical protein [Fortiea sp. LEGE XX443]